jgi:Flp pilus assembly protein TadG
MKPRCLFRDRLGRRAVAAVEFALIIPVLLVLFIGTIEILTLYRTEAKLNALAINVAQMVAVTQSVSLATASATAGTPTVTSLNDICEGAMAGLAPFPSAGLKIAVASVTLEPSAANSSSPAATPAYDEWEADSKMATSSTCSTATGTTILGGTGTAPIQIATSNTVSTSGSVTTISSGMLHEPCDNIIIVQASLTYPGLTGLILTGNRPVLTQTAYSRWTNASTLTQLLCSNCTLQPTKPKNFCNANNTALN